jgi:ABC-type amino acid transport substrate-binding protein
MNVFARSCWSLLLLGAAVLATAAEVVRIPRPEVVTDRRSDYADQLLQLALSKSGGDYRIEYTAQPMNQERQAAELEAGRLIEVAPIPASAEREARLLAVRIPVNRGLLGWRLGLIRRGDQARFDQVKTLDDLRGLRIGQGQEWPDTPILRANGIAVIAGPRYEGLFDMLTAQRFDYFPRGLTEVWEEVGSRTDALEVESRFVVHYPYDAYFMLNRKSTRLAADIERGLERAIADGSFDQLFDQHFGERLRRARLHERIVIEMKNPLLTPGTPLHRSELWYDFRRWPAKPR